MGYLGPPAVCDLAGEVTQTRVLEYIAEFHFHSERFPQSRNHCYRQQRVPA
jgi:hypothetical protein